MNTWINSPSGKKKVGKLNVLGILGMAARNKTLFIRGYMTALSTENKTDSLEFSTTSEMFLSSYLQQFPDF